MKYNYYMRDTITNDGVLNTVFTYLPGIVLILGGYLFIVFKNIQWNNPLSLLYKSEKQVVNEITGRIWVIGGISLSIFLTIIRPVHSPLLIIALYLLTIVVSFLITFVMIKMKKSQDKQSIK